MALTLRRTELAGTHGEGRDECPAADGADACSETNDRLSVNPSSSFRGCSGGAWWRC